MKRTLLGCFASVLLVVATAVPLNADVRLPEIFASDMVLQRDMTVPVWGWADAGETVTVSFEGQTKTADADASGRWQVELAPLKAGGPFTMTIKGNNELKLENVLVGEVWLCSGQSNMEWTMNSSPDSRAEIPSIDNPRIRLFKVNKAWAQRPQDKLPAAWTPCNPETVLSFSAVGYYFGSKLNADLDVPVGLISSSWGGTRIEPWTTPQGFEAVSSLSDISRRIAAKDPSTELHKQLVVQTLKEYKEWIATTEKNLAETQPVDPPPKYPDLLAPYENHQQPTVLHNAMVVPFTPLSIRGAIWYQGESNLADGMLYAEKMKALILGWRTLFKNEDLGFYFAQLAPYNYGGDGTRLPRIWEAQAAVEKAMSKTGMAVINDIGNLKDIHPANKKIVGTRLALLALNRTYGKTDVVCASPEMKEMNIVGDTILLSFANAKELKTRDGKTPDWFEMAGADGVWHKAQAVIDGTTIRLKNAEVSKPYAVRFAWDQLAEPNVQNEAGLQLGAFRAGESPERGLFDSLIPDAKKFELLYSFDPTRPILANDRCDFVYKTNRSKDLAGKAKRVGYFLYLKPKQGKERFVFVTLPAPDGDFGKLGVPTKGTGVRLQKMLTDVTVVSNVEGIETGTFAEGCNIEFWDCNYGPRNAANVPGASTDVFDFGDEINGGTSPGYGSMQIHNAAKKQTIFSLSNFGAGNNCDLGIGNCPTGDHLDWTFSGSAKNYAGGQMMIFVEVE